MSRLLEWNTLQEAADYLTGELGENWTPRMVLDAGERGSFKVCFVLPHDTKAWAGDTEEWLADKAELMPNSINQLLNHETVLVRWVPFTNQKTKHETHVELKPRPQISFDEIRIRGSELETFALKDAPPANVEAAKPGITKGAVINAFEGLYFDRDKWNKYLGDPPEWLACCRAAKGSKKASATWWPHLIAAALYDKKISIKRLDAVFVSLKDWADEWQEASASIRD